MTVQHHTSEIPVDSYSSYVIGKVPTNDTIPRTDGEDATGGALTYLQGCICENVVKTIPAVNYS